MTVYTCKDNFTAKMTCIHAAFASGISYQDIRLLTEPVSQLSLFEQYIHVEEDNDKTELVLDTIAKKISKEACLWVYYVSLSADHTSLDLIYRFLILGFHYGKQITDMLQNPVVMKMMELRRKVGNEAHSFREFARFTAYYDRGYIALIEPKSNVLPYVANYFMDRMPSENFIIVDDTRRLAAIHPKNTPFYLSELDEATYLQFKKAACADDLDPFVHYWKEYFKSIAIKERTNPNCQMSHFPLWMRKHVTEF